MIAQLRGTVANVTMSSVILDVAGVGYLVLCSPNTIAGLHTARDATLHTSMVVREDSLTLYGFATVEERDMFELVQTASGVGPKVAQAMLAVFDPERLRSAIAGADHATLTQVPGIGKKGAERIVVELKDRVGTTAASSVSGGSSPWRGQVLDALTGLGWSAKDAESAIERVSDDLPDDVEVAAVLKAALRSMDSRGRR